MNFAAFLGDIHCLVNLILNAREDDITNQLQFSCFKDEYLKNKTSWMCLDGVF